MCKLKSVLHFVLYVLHFYGFYGCFLGQPNQILYKKNRVTKPFDLVTRFLRWYG